MATKTSNPAEAPATESGIAEQIAALRAQLQALESSFNQRLDELEARIEEHAAPEATPEVTPEILAIISAAVTSFLGKKVRIRSARLVRPSGLNAWAQQGRVVIQASHNLPR